MADESQHTSPPSSAGAQSPYDAVVQSMAKATATAQTLSDRMDIVESTNKSNRRLLKGLLALMVAKLITLVILVILFFSLSDVAARNKETLRKIGEVATVLNECTTDSPAKADPPRVPVNKEDEIHECREQGYVNQGSAIGQLRDTNKNNIPDNLEILDYLDDGVKNHSTEGVK